MKKIMILGYVLLSILLLTACTTSATYENFENNMNINLGWSAILTRGDDGSFKYNVDKKSFNRKSYDKKSYIYIYKGDGFKQEGALIDERCVYGFITDKDDLKQIKKKWIILSKKEYCKQKLRVVCCM